MAAAAVQFDEAIHGCPLKLPPAATRLAWYFAQRGGPPDIPTNRAFPSLALVIFEEPCTSAQCQNPRTAPTCGRTAHVDDNTSWAMIDEIKDGTVTVFSIIELFEAVVEEVYWPMAWASKTAGAKITYLRTMIAWLQKAGCFGSPHAESTHKTIPAPPPAKAKVSRDAGYYVVEPADGRQPAAALVLSGQRVPTGNRITLDLRMRRVRHACKDYHAAKDVYQNLKFGNYVGRDPASGEPLSSVQILQIIGANTPAPSRGPTCIG
jgi:hypothetical protein